MADLLLDFQFKSPINKVWDALTNSDTLAQWVMVNNFKPIVGPARGRGRRGRRPAHGDGRLPDPVQKLRRLLQGGRRRPGHAR